MAGKPEFDLRQLRSFIVVAEEGHFGRAAAKLGIAQPPLSQQIRRLESKIGFTLFDRGTRKVVLTAAGESLVDTARKILEQAQDGLDSARRAARGEEGVLRIGINPSLALTELMRVLQTYRRENDKVTLAFHEMTSQPQVNSLLMGDIDIGFLRETYSVQSLESRPLIEEPLMVVLPENHPLAKLDTVDLSELGHETFILISRQSGSALYDRIVAACRLSGFQPLIGQEATEWSTIAALVGCGLGVALAPNCVRRLNIPGVAYRSVSPMLSTVVTMAWRQNDRSPIVQRFLRHAQRAYSRISE
ncbi:LysR family transcriptional regulator [Ensifer adhaerens]|uniref:LysR substrate-binding domain-containing protein n=1 Tax=Ensifer adhaerens TaxID=106592 RepID=UPI001CC0EEF3|nr:LysR substrate-binding domain-containing protein [Ensifer adhaerens]MBZ7924251.1 LysR family transcriptional regulator [Ensifer adhaerens]UAX96495.1 LysR family transcriptional regulator [Ensifer adhaerens]UAY04161.1 LysR family transcriptional regulator [Ensifer adhaerens]UAY12147.1 LysR family transcriptional regulator [Ensifer adhaerens]